MFKFVIHNPHTKKAVAEAEVNIKEIAPWLTTPTEAMSVANQVSQAMCDAILKSTGEAYAMHVYEM